jgi:hypothetical protein
MKSKLFAGCLISLAATACQPLDYIDPDDDPTGNSPAVQIFKFDAETAPTFLNANLQASNAVQAEYTVAEQNGARVLVPVKVGGAFPETAGADADLLASVGFGTYINPDRNATEWEVGSFQSKLTAEIILNNPGDAVKFCRSFATTCVTAQMAADGSGLVVLNLAANVPDTEIGEIADGVSAAIRGTGEAGLTIAVTDPTEVARPFQVTAGTPFTLEWTVARGPITGLPEGAGSISYSVSVNDTELVTKDTLTALGAAIVKDGGVAMKFEVPVGTDVKTEADFTYEFQGATGNFEDPFAAVGAGEVAVSPQLDLAATPLLVYPTLNPGIPILTLGGDPTKPYAAQDSDAVLGAPTEIPGPGETEVTISSATFNGDDFEGTPVAGAVDQGITGGGFYPSPAFCYSQIFPLVEAQVRAGARKETHRQMFAQIGTGIAQANQALDGAPGYTVLTLADIITIATDYADNNVDMNIATSEGATYTVTLMQTVSQTFVAQLTAIVEANPDPALVTLLGGLTTPPGKKETFEGGLALALKDRINGTNVTGTNPPPSPPVLAAACLWGRSAQAEVPATDAVLVPDTDFTNDAPAYPAVPAQPALVPVREQAAAQINQLVIGVFGNFIGQVFGLTVPASNFSLSMEVGDPAGDTSPAVSSIVITAQ